MIDLTKDPDRLARTGLIPQEQYNILRMKSGWLPDALLELTCKINILKTANIASPEDLNELERSIHSYLLFSHSINNKLRHILLSGNISKEDKFLALKDGGEVEKIFISPDLGSSFDHTKAPLDEDHRAIQVLIGVEAYGLADLCERNNAHRFIDFCLLHSYNFHLPECWPFIRGKVWEVSLQAPCSPERWFVRNIRWDAPLEPTEKPYQ
nr:hypothetical protein [Endozoicomonas sp.]